MTKEKFEYFKDLNTNVSGQGDLLVTNFRAINNQINNIISTSLGELPFEPEFGSNILDLLFDPLDETTAWKIEVELLEAIERWQPNIEINRAKTIVSPNFNDVSYNVNIAYFVPALDDLGENRVQLSKI